MKEGSNFLHLKLTEGVIKTLLLLEFDLETIESEVFVRLLCWSDGYQRILCAMVEVHLCLFLQFNVDVTDWFSAVSTATTNDASKLPSLILEESAERDSTAL